VEELVDFLCCKLASLPMNYLGFPLGSFFKVAMVRSLDLKEWRKDWLDGRNFTCLKVASHTS
jgi:hypothetical protein